MYFRELRNIQKAWKTRNIRKARKNRKTQNIQKTRKNRNIRKARKARKNRKSPENPSVHPWGIEPQPKEPESFILSIKLWVHYRPLSP